MVIPLPPCRNKVFIFSQRFQFLRILIIEKLFLVFFSWIARPGDDWSKKLFWMLRRSCKMEPVKAPKSSKSITKQRVWAIKALQNHFKTTETLIKPMEMHDLNIKSRYFCLTGQKVSLWGTGRVPVDWLKKHFLIEKTFSDCQKSFYSIHFDFWKSW